MALRVMRIMITTKTSRFILALLHILIVAVVVDSAGRSLPRAIIFDDDLVSDGIDGHDHVRRQQDQLINSSLLLLPSREFELYDYSSEEHKCEQMYGFLPCSDNIFGHLFLIVVYEYLLFHGESYLAEGSERIFKILGPGFFGASAFHVLGALPESLLLLASGLLNTKEKAQEYVFTGVGLLAGSSILLLTVVWGTCVIAGSQEFSKITKRTSNSSNIIENNYSKFATISLQYKRLRAFLTGCGITVDLETNYLARVMVFSVIPFVIMQIANIFQVYSGEKTSILITLLVSLVLLFLYFVYQIFQPWIQKRRLEYVKHAHLISSILQHVQERALGRLLTQNGAPNVHAIRRLFDEIDEDRDNFISASEVKQLFLEIKFTAVEADKEQAMEEVMAKFDLDGDRKITKDEFVDGLTKWLGEVKYAVDQQIYSPRSLKDIYQVFQPWVQNKRKEREIKTSIMLDIQENFRRNEQESLLMENGKPNLRNIGRLFEKFDRDRDNFISQSELKALILDIRFGRVPNPMDVNEAVKGLMEELDTNGDNLISEQEFVKGLEEWLLNTTRTNQASNSSVPSEDDIHQKSWEETDKLVEEEEKKNGIVDNSPQAWMKAIMYLVIGVVTLSLLAEPLIESVQKFSEFAGIPSFFISFILVPLATTARAATSAITTANHKTPRTTSLTFSEIYGGVFMNNILGFSVLLALIYFREMTWEFSAEVLVVLIVCFIVGLIASFRYSLTLWTASLAYLLYPISLLLVHVFNDVLHYN